MRLQLSSSFSVRDSWSQKKNFLFDDLNLSKKTRPVVHWGILMYSQSSGNMMRSSSTVPKRRFNNFLRVTPKCELYTLKLLAINLIPLSLCFNNRKFHTMYLSYVPSNKSASGNLRSDISKGVPCVCPGAKCFLRQMLNFYFYILMSPFFFVCKIRCFHILRLTSR